MESKDDLGLEKRLLFFRDIEEVVDDDHDDDNDNEDGDDGDTWFCFIGLISLGNKECNRLDLECFLVGFLLELNW